MSLSNHSLNVSFIDWTGAIFIVCLVITSRCEFSWSPALYLLASVKFHTVEVTIFFLYELNYSTFCFALIFECSLWSSAIILLVLAMIVVDLMVIFPNISSFVFVSFCVWVATYHCILVILFNSVLILFHANCLLTLSDLPVLCSP